MRNLKSSNIVISQKTVVNILGNKGKRRQAKAEGLKSPTKIQPRTARTAEVIRKVNVMTSLENPPPQTEMARKAKVSASTVRRIIADLKKVKRRKTRVHKMTSAHMANRKTTCQKMYEGLLSGNKSEFMVTLDEAMFGVHNCNGKRSICYVQKGEEIPENWFVDKDNFLKTFMVVAAISGRGTLPLIRVPKKVKVNAEWYISHVLVPLLETHLPRLYPGELEKVTVHHDKASSHTAKKTQDYATDLQARLGISIMKSPDIPVKSPDVSPLDFFGFGYLKRKLFQRRPTTEKGVWKVLQKEWRKVDRLAISRVYSSWKRRLRCVAKGHGKHIENTKIFIAVSSKALQIKTR